MKNALVIDDNRSAAESLGKLLGLLDVTTRTAFGARAAILALGEFTPDIIFLDINMPGLSGFEVLSYLKREPTTRRIPVVIVSAEEDIQTALTMGALAALGKPASLEDLEDVLRRAGLNE